MLIRSLGHRANPFSMWISRDLNRFTEGMHMHGCLMQDDGTALSYASIVGPESAGVLDHIPWGSMALHTPPFPVWDGRVPPTGVPIRSALACDICRPHRWVGISTPHSGRAEDLPLASRTARFPFFSTKTRKQPLLRTVPHKRRTFAANRRWEYCLLEMKMITCRIRRRCEGAGPSIFATIRKDVLQRKTTVMTISLGTRAFPHRAAIILCGIAARCLRLRIARVLWPLLSRQCVWDYMKRAYGSRAAKGDRHTVRSRLCILVLARVRYKKTGAFSCGAPALLRAGKGEQGIPVWA